jgi:DNA-binding protein HU-beta
MSDQAQTAGDLNYSDLVAAAAAEAGVSQATVKKVLRATFDVVGRTTASGHRVTVTNFGTWRRRAFTNNRNPVTGEAAAPSAGVVFRSVGRLSEWAKSGRPGTTLAKSPKSY